MAKKFLTGLTLVNLPSDPSVGSEGELYFNTSASVAKIYKEGAWSELGAGGGAAITVSTTEPASPNIGDAWYKNDTGEFYVYDGTYWVEVNGTISLTQEQVQDYVAPLFTNATNTNVIATYDDANNVINLNTSGSLISVDSITYPDYITFDTTPEVIPTAPGSLYWDSGDGLPATVLNANVSIGIGQEQIALVKNATGSSIAKGKVVYISGAQGQRPTITLSDADTETTSSKTFGVTSEVIADGAEGFVTTFGVLRGINTDGLTEGGAIWLSQTAGNFTQTIPAEPAHTVFIGYVVKAHASSGEIFVNIQNGYELNELHGVLINGVSDNQALVYNSSASLWYNESIVNSLQGTENEINVSASTGNITIGIPDSPLFITPNIGAATATSINGTTIPTSASLATTEDLYYYLTSASAALLYQPISVRLFNLTALENVEGFLRTDGGLGWGIDTAEYLTTGNASSTYLTQLDASDLYLTQIDAENTYLTPVTSASIYQPLDDDLTAIAALSGSSGFLKKTLTNTWTLDTNTYITTYDAGITYQPIGNYATISGAETLTNKTMSSAFVNDVLTFDDGANSSTIDVAGDNLTINAYDDLYLTTTIGDIVLQPDHFVKIYDEYVATQEWVGFQNYLTQSSASTTYQPIGSYSTTSHNHTLDSLSNVVITGTPADGQAIVWDTATSKWVNETVSGGGGASYPDQTGNDGKFLQTNSGSVSWQNVDFTGYLTESSASTTYLTQASASSTYQPVGSYLTSESDTLETVTDRGASSTNAITITNATAASSPTTGALIVTGGVGIGEDLYVNNDVHIGGDIHITGSISGSLTYVNVSDLVVTDPLIYLAESNPNDSVDIGIFGALNHSSSAYYHTGLIRDASDSGKWKLASNLLDPINNIIDFTGATFDTLKIGALEVTDASTTRTNLGLAIGTDVQAYNSTLAAVAGGTYTGDDSITTVGTITVGTWNGSTIGYAYGGTGLTTLGAAGQVLKVNSGATALEWGSAGPSFTDSAGLASIISDETGTGSLVFADTPTLITPNIGVATATSINGTTIPSSVTLTKTSDNLSVFASTTSAELASIITNETGSGSLVFSNSPTLVTPNIGAATGTSLTTTGNVISHTDILTPTFVTNSYTLTIGDDGDILMLNNSTTAGNLLIPTDASVNFPIGTQITIVQQGTGLITVSAVTPATTTLNSTPGAKLRAQWSSASLIKTAANTWLLVGDLTV